MDTIIVSFEGLRNICCVLGKDDETCFHAQRTNSICDAKTCPLKEEYMCECKMSGASEYCSKCGGKIFKK